MRILFIILILSFTFCQQTYAKPVFDVFALGVYGGLDDGNLSSWLVKPIEEENYVSLDSGTLVNGLVKSFGQSAHKIMTHHIPTYLISHAHLDHYIGFLMAQPELRQQQTVMAREETLQALLSTVFTWSIWGNFGDQGDKPQLGFQHYRKLPLLVWQIIPGTTMQVKALPLNHGNGFPSTAFLIRYKDDYLLYFGDTGADSIENSQAMQAVWAEVAPLIRAGQLHSILLECSFQDTQPTNQLFGHLTSSLYMEELHQLAGLVNKSHPEKALADLSVFVTHVKPTADTVGTMQTAQVILGELEAKNDLRLHLILPQQGEHYTV